MTMAVDEIAELRRRIEQLEDEREIRYLVGRYGHYCDLGHEDAWADQWTDDAVYDIVTVKRNGAGYDGGIRFEGKDQLYAMIRDPVAHKLFEGRSLHLQDFNLVIRIDGDEACAHGYSMTMLRDLETEAIEIRTAGMVRWAFKRVDGRWRIIEKKRRKVGDGSAFEDTPAMSAHDAAKPA
jgi:hypothetical protein